MLNVLIENIWLAPVFPLLGFGMIGFFRNKLSEKAIGWFGTSAVLLSFSFSVLLFFEVNSNAETAFARTTTLYSWIATAGVHINITFLVDHLTIVMLLLITGMSSLLHIYAIGFMSGRDGFAGYFSFMNLAIFFLLILVLADNFLLLLTGWSGLSICLYLLLSLNNQDEAAIRAGQSAFIFGRAGDFFLLLAGLVIFTFFATFDFEQVFRNSVRTISQPGLATTIGLLLTFAVACKAAKVPFHVWVPDAAIAPIPVFAFVVGLCLPVAAIYLVARSHVLFLHAPLAMSFLSVLGLLTAFLAATIAAVTDDVKRVLTYAAISQVGFMALALGVGAFDSAIFHLITQTVVICLLFLSIGVLEYSTNGVKSALVLRQKVPPSYRGFLIGALTLSGTPMLSGFFSRNEILWRALGSQPLGGFGFWVIGALLTGLTVFYIFRIFFLKFHANGEPTETTDVDVKQPAPAMLTPLYILAFLTFAVGLIGLPHFSKLQGFLEPVFTGYVKTDLFDMEPQMLPLEISFTAIVILISLIGFGFSYMLYIVRPEMPEQISKSIKPVHSFLIQKWYIEDLYRAMLVQPVRALAEFSAHTVNSKILDKLAVLLPKALENISLQLNKLQTGLIRNYILSFILAIVVVFTYLFLSSFR